MKLDNKNFRTAVILCGGKGPSLGLLGKKIPQCGFLHTVYFLR